MTILMLWWILGLIGLLISDKSTAVMIVEKKMSRSTPIDCEIYVYHPQCRGVQSKKRLILKEKNNGMSEDSKNIIVEDDKKPYICVCNYKTTMCMPLIEKKQQKFGMFGRLGRNKAVEERNSRKLKKEYLQE